MSGKVQVFKSVRDNAINVIKLHLARKSINEIASELKNAKKEVLVIIFKFKSV